MPIFAEQSLPFLLARPIGGDELRRGLHRHRGSHHSVNNRPIDDEVIEDCTRRACSALQRLHDKLPCRKMAP